VEAAQIIEPKHYEPTEWQLEDLAKLTRLKRSANWSEMGCYKTTTIQWLMEDLLETTPEPKVLIVTTRSGKGTYFQTLPEVLPGWAIFNVLTKEIRLYYDGEEHNIGDDIDKASIAGHPTIILTHYNVFSRRKPKKIKGAGAKTLEALIAQTQEKANPRVTLLDRLQKTEWDFIGLDEAHRIKGRDTGWTKEINKLKGTYKHVMTGTGFINDPSEVWGLLHWLDPQRFSSYWKFREYFCEEDDSNGYRQIIGPRQETKEEFRALLRSLGPRRTKMEVFKDLKEPIRTGVPVELNDIQRKMYDDIKNELFTLDQNGEEFFSPNVLSALIRLRQISVATPEVVENYFDEETQKRKQVIKLVEPSSKLDALMELIEGLEWDEERKDQIVVFSMFKDPIKLAIERFKQAGISYIHMEEKDSDQERYQKWAIDFPEKQAQVFICTLQLGGESITLTSASTCVFLDRSWSPKDNSQGESRVWRPGQTGVANIVNINAGHTVDEIIEDRVNRKLGWFEQIFGNESKGAPTSDSD
jgi:SNF2 family DNA or RNA helicase